MHWAQSLFIWPNLRYALQKRYIKYTLCEAARNDYFRCTWTAKRFEVGTAVKESRSMRLKILAEV